jgi:2Fe-2S ferredoxin
MTKRKRRVSARAFDAKPTSRLSCQIKVEEALDDLVVRTPAYQGR